ncbi:hypothetical protein [Micromonospora sp. NPDC005203]|uniref:hypothetical protein n=1 Tax=Micromonospora sp. NPDC005203 TaxID=3364226 RepID=UPI0036AFF0EA
MLLIGASGVTRRAAGVGLLAAMVISVGAVLSPVSTRPGVQFLFENARRRGGPTFEAYALDDVVNPRYLFVCRALLDAYPGSRTFSFRSANVAQGRLVAYASDGQPIASYDEELAAALRTVTR